MTLFEILQSVEYRPEYGAPRAGWIGLVLRPGGTKYQGYVHEVDEDAGLVLIGPSDPADGSCSECSAIRIDDIAAIENVTYPGRGHPWT